jgi:hypothetical protein
MPETPTDLSRPTAHGMSGGDVLFLLSLVFVAVAITVTIFVR